MVLNILDFISIHLGPINLFNRSRRDFKSDFLKFTFSRFFVELNVWNIYG